MGAPAPATAVRRRSEIEIRWRQARNVPRPVVRAVLSSTVVAVILGLLLLVYDVAVAQGAELPGGDLTALAVALYVVGVLVAGTVITYVVVPQPTGAGGRPRRSVWSGALGFFAALPIAYIGLVVESQVLKPLILGS